MSERFELLQQIGTGGMGIVWKARDNETGEIIALKLLHELYLNDADYVARLEREVEIARRIESPHVVKVLGYGERNGVPYVAMEYIEGGSLRELLRERGTLPWDEAKRILRETAEGLAAVHAANVIHRDIKPSNILIASDGTVKLADFGIARSGDLTQMTSSATMLGTPAYMSPDIDASERSDLYGLGCVLFEMLAGAPPFPGESQQQVFLRHIREAPDVAKLPPEARPIASWLLAKDPARRTPSVAALLAALAGSSKYGRHTPIVARRRWRVMAAVGLPCVVAIGGIGAMLWAGGAGGGDARGAGVSTDTATPAGATSTRVAGTEVARTVGFTATASATPTTVAVVTLEATSTAVPTATASQREATATPTPWPTPTRVIFGTITQIPSPTPTAATASPELTAPRLLNPSQDSSRAGSIALEWGAVPGAVAYEVERNQADSLHGSVPRVSLRTADTRLTVDNSDVGTTSWRVRAVGANTALGPWSDYGRYSFSPSTPTPTATQPPLVVPPTVAAPSLLGGVADLNGYCRSIGDNRAELGDLSWWCIYEVGDPHSNIGTVLRIDSLDFTAACRWAYPGAGSVSARQSASSDPYSWKCYGIQ